MEPSYNSLPYLLHKPFGKYLVHIKYKPETTTDHMQNLALPIYLCAKMFLIYCHVEKGSPHNLFIYY